MTTLYSREPRMRVPHHPAHCEGCQKTPLLVRLWRWARRIFKW